MAEITTTLRHGAFRGCFTLTLFVCSAGLARTAPLEDFTEQRLAKLKETEYYQLQIAEKYFRATSSRWPPMSMKSF